MSDSSQAFATASIHAFSHRPSRPANAVPRYGTGLALVVAVHAGAFIAFGSGLDIGSIEPQLPPIIARVVTPPPAIDPTPLDHRRPDLTDVSIRTIDAPEPIIVDYAEPPATPTGAAAPRSATPPTESSGMQVREARSDPRHPLTQPAYPAQSRRLGEQGRVELLVYVQPDGRVSAAQVATSSGFERLDDAAVREAVRAWRMLPHTVDGAAVGSWCRVAIAFRLKD